MRRFGGNDHPRPIGRPTCRTVFRWLPVLVLTVTLAACGGTAAVHGSGPRSSAPPTSGPPPTASSSTGVPSTAAGALHFARPQALSRGTALVSVSCGSATSCVALDASGRAYHFDGSSWSAPVPSSAQAIGAGAISVSCAEPTLCMAVATAGNQVVSWNGQQWSTPVTLSGATGLGAVGCAPTGYCATVDAEGNAFAFGGQAWHATSNDWGSVSAISCVSATLCMSVSGGISQWNGQTWTQPASFGTTSSFSGVSCPTVSFCSAVDQGGQALQWNGLHWSAPSPIEAASDSATALGVEPTGVSCPATTVCVAVDNAGGAVQWLAGSRSRTVIDPGGQLSSISCPTPSFCVAVDKAGRVLTGRP